MMNAWILLALLPIPPKRLDKIPGYPVDTQKLDALQVTHEIISSILSPLCNVSDVTSQSSIEMVCCNEKVQNCIPMLCGWLADHMENVMIHGISSNRCLICIAPPDQFGELSNASYTTRPHPMYAAAFHHSDIHILNSHGVKNINNALWHIPIEPHEIVRPNILHVLLLGILVHLMKWVQEFLDHVERLTIFDYIWSRLPPFLGFSRPNKAYRSVSQ